MCTYNESELSLSICINIYVYVCIFMHVIIFYISATFESIGNALAAAESGVFNESETKVYLFMYMVILI